MEKTLPIKLPGKKKEEEFTRKFNQMEFSRNLKILKKQSHFKLMVKRITNEMIDRVNGFNMDEGGLGQNIKKIEQSGNYN